MTPLPRASVLLFPVAFLLEAHASAQQPDRTRWTENFSDPETLTKHWDIYGFLASGIPKETPL